MVKLTGSILALENQSEQKNNNKFVEKWIQRHKSVLELTMIASFAQEAE